jgi:hypothetical protein
MRQKDARHELGKDMILILIGAVIAIVLAQLGFIDWFSRFLGSQAMASFVAGIFFTSSFTIAPSAVVLARLGTVAPLQVVAFWGALGAMFGDLVLFYFIRDRFAADLVSSIRPSFTRHILQSLHFGFLKWLSPFLGAIIIASPLPDELGLTLLGLSKTRISLLLPIAFLMNLIGIYALISFAHLV